MVVFKYKTLVKWDKELPEDTRDLLHSLAINLRFEGKTDDIPIIEPQPGTDIINVERLWADLESASTWTEAVSQFGPVSVEVFEIDES